MTSQKTMKTPRAVRAMTLKALKKDRIRPPGAELPSGAGGYGGNGGLGGCGGGDGGDGGGGGRGGGDGGGGGEGGGSGGADGDRAPKICCRPWSGVEATL